MKHERTLDRKDGGRWTQREHLQGLIDRGQASDADLAAFDGPPLPECGRYLLQWLYELHGRSGVSMNGLAPLSYPVIAEWARLTGRDPQPHEVEALIRLDAELLALEVPPDNGKEA